MKYIITLWFCASAIFTQAQRPTPATTGDLVLMKSHIYDMVNSFFEKMQKKIDSLTNRVSALESGILEKVDTGGTFKLRYSVDQHINCIDGIWHLTTEVNDSHLGKRYSHTIKSTLKGIKMLKKAEYDAAFDALAEINVSDRQTEHTAP